MSHAINYTFQPVPCITSNRDTLETLGIGRYTVANLGNRVLLFARTSKNFGLVMHIGPEEREPKIQGRLYTHFTDVLHVRERAPGIGIECNLPPVRELNRAVPIVVKVGTTPSREERELIHKRERIISRLIVQENGGRRCNETKSVELKVNTFRHTPSVKMLHTQE